MSKSTVPESYPIKFRAQPKGKVLIRLQRSQCTVDGEAAIKLAHGLMATAEKALRAAGRVSDK